MLKFKSREKQKRNQQNSDSLYNIQGKYYQELTHCSKTKLSQERIAIIITHSLLLNFLSPRLHKACIPSSSCKLLPPTADALSCVASKWTLPFLTSKEALALSTAAWEGGRDCTLTWAVDCWPCWPSWRLGKNTDWGDITGKKRENNS